MTGTIAATATLTATRIVEALQEARRRTFALVASVSDDDLDRVHSPLMSPLVWDLAHIAAYEDLWLVHRYGERPLLRDDLAAMYDAFETPRAVRGDLPLLGPAQALEYLDEVRSRSLEVIDERGIGDGLLHEMVLRHEHQHDETMLQTLMLARLDGYELAGRRSMPDSARPAPTGLDMVEIPAGECTIGAARGGFAYDNERPPPPHGCARLPDRADRCHQRELSDVRRARGLRASRVVVRRRVGLEGAVRHHETWCVDG